MATTDYDFTQTRNQLIERAFRIIGALSLGEVMSGDAMIQGSTALNAMVKSWQSDHVFLWTTEYISLPVVAFTQRIDLHQAILAITPGYLRPIITVDAASLILSGTEEPLVRMSYRDFQQILLDKISDTGDPTHFAIEHQRDPLMYLYPTPTRDIALFLLAICKLKDFDLAGGDGDFPVKWLDALTYGLAANLADEYGLPIGERQTLGQKSQAMYRDAKRGDRDTSDYDFVQGAFCR